MLGSFINTIFFSRMVGNCFAVIHVLMHTIPTACHHLCLRSQMENGHVSVVHVNLSRDGCRRSSFGGLCFLFIIIIIPSDSLFVCRLHHLLLYI